MKPLKSVLLAPFLLSSLSFISLPTEHPTASLFPSLLEASYPAFFFLILLHLFLCRLLHYHFIYLNYSAVLKTNMSKIRSLPFTWTACKWQCSCTQHDHLLLFPWDPALPLCSGCSLSSSFTLLPKSEVPPPAPQLWTYCSWLLPIDDTPHLSDQSERKSPLSIR